MSIRNINYLNKNLVLLYTGIKRTAQHVAKSYVNKLNKDKKNEIKQILSFVREAENILENNRYNDFGRLLHESWLTKKKLSSKVSNLSIENIYEGSFGRQIIRRWRRRLFFIICTFRKTKKIIKTF